ncbi:TPA: hypothetical protein J1269_003917 [Escherichia coli]|nr:hypothetical protein [Escherichia coli]
MKKTLIALAVAASAAVSGSAMAWTQNGSGGSVDLGGTLTPTTKATPWEVKTGAAVTGLNAQIQKGQKEVSITVNKSIPVLGIRVADAVNKTFMGGKRGIIPQIDYNGAINTSQFNGGVVPVNLVVKDAQDQTIGKMVVDMIAYGESSWGNPGAGHKQVFASESGSAFFGGLGESKSAVFSNGLYERVVALDSEYVANYISQGGNTEIGNEVFQDAKQFSAFYGSGIEQGKIIKITLDQAASSDAPIQWNASLPVTVFYQ